MNREKTYYVSPEVEVVNVEVENGFATSGIDDMPYGDNNW